MDDVIPKTAAELWDSIARGDWVIAFGLLTTLLTRLFAIRPLQAKIPKSWLRYIAVALGILTQASAALAGGAGWGKAVTTGLVAGLAAIGFWEVGIKSAPIVKKKGGGITSAGVISVFGVLCLILPLLLLSCASTFPGKVSQASTAVASLRQVARGAYKVKCGLAVDECKKTKSPTSQPTLNDCKLWKECDAQRLQIFMVASGVQVLLDTSLTLWQMGKPEDAAAVFEQAKAAFTNLQQKIAKYKLLDVLKLP